MKTLIIAEKPSLAREIKSMLSNKYGEKWVENGNYSESQSYIISSFFGHLLQQFYPEDYDPKFKEWKYENLPIIPEIWKFKYSKGKGIEERGKLLKKLSEKCSSIINACDPDKEGEGIFRRWQEYEGITKHVKRLWSPSLAEKDLKKAWDNIQDSCNYDNLYEAQKMRSYGDWLIGMNATPVYSLTVGKLMPIGRVMTATLGLIVRRDLEIENYKETYKYLLRGKWGGLTFTYYYDKKKEYDTEEELQEISEQIHNDIFQQIDIKVNKKETNPPKTYNQPELQKDANIKFGFSLAKTLNITQSLYENKKKLITYPRTDSSYLPYSDLKEYYKLLKTVSTEEELLLLREGEKPACVKNTNDPHTAIIPTGEKPINLTDDESKIYGLIRDRFVTAFMKPEKYEEIIINISNSKGAFFSSTAKKVIDPGFKKLKSQNDDEKNNVQEFDKDLDLLRILKEKIIDLKVDKKTSTKPKYYTPATLITAMMNVGKKAENKDIKEALKEVDGLGTPATRDSFPEKLKDYSYISQVGKNYKSTTKGRELIRVINPELSNPEMTGEWEIKLGKIERGELHSKAFYSEIIQFVNSIIKIDKSKVIEIKNKLENDSILCKCPSCNGNILEYAKIYKCNNSKCEIKVFKNIFGKKISSKDAKKLLENKRTGLIKGFTKKDKSGKYDAILTFDKEWKIKLEFPQRKKSN